MAATSFTLTPDNGSDTTFRAWVAALITQLDAMTGWARTGDTGQINTATATRSNLSTVNYAVWKTTDMAPDIYLRLDFNNTFNSSLFPCVGVTIGYATNGAGSIQGIQATTRQLGSVNVANDAAVRTCLISSANGRMCLAFVINSTSTSGTFLISVERSRDTAGAATADGAIINLCGSGGAIYSQYLPATGGIPTAETRFPAILTNAASSVFGTTIGLSPIIPLAGAALNPGINLLAHHSADFTRDTQHTIPVYGTNRNYYILGPNIASIVGVGGVTSTTGRLAMLYE